MKVKKRKQDLNSLINKLDELIETVVQRRHLDDYEIFDPNNYDIVKKDSLDKRNKHV